MNDLASLLSGGPAKITFGAVTLLTKDGVNLPADVGAFLVDVDNFGTVDQRVSQANVTVGFTPAGVFGDFAEFFRVLNQAPGDYIVPVVAIGAINTTTDVITATRHALRTGDAVYLAAVGSAVLPAVIVEGTRYYVRRVTADTLTLHDTAAHASANTDKINFADDGTGTLALIAELPLVIHTTRGKKITFHNCACIQPPQLDLSAVRTVFGAVQFKAFRRHGTEWADANSLYTVTDEAYTDPTFDAADILTQCYSGAWGSTAPWSAITTENGFQVDVGLSLTDKGTDCEGTINQQIEGLTVTAKFVPIGISEEDILGKLRLQGASTGRGQSLNSGSEDLILEGAGVYIALYNAQLTGGSARFNRKDYRSGELTLGATRDGSAPTNALAYVGTAAP